MCKSTSENFKCYFIRKKEKETEIERKQQQQQLLRKLSPSNIKTNQVSML